MTKEGKSNFLTLDDLGAFTEDILLPAIRTIVKDSFKEDEFKTEVKKIVMEENGKLKYELKDYIDSKLTDFKGDIISYVKEGKEKDKQWKGKAVEIFKENNLAGNQDLQLLSDLIR